MPAQASCSSRSKYADTRVESVGDEVIWTTATPIAGDQRAIVDVILDAFHDLPDHPGADVAGYFARLADRDAHVIEVGGDRFELRD